MVLEKYRFEYRKPDALLHKRIEQVVGKMTLEASQTLYPIHSTFGKTLFCRIGDIILLPMVTGTKPRGRRMIGFRETDLQTFDPKKSEEYRALATILEVSTAVEAVTFHQAMECDFAVVEKRSFPSPIESNDDAVRHSFTLTISEQNFLNEHQSLWWQLWGGVLTRYTFTSKRPMIVETSEILRRSLGQFKARPSSLVR